MKPVKFEYFDPSTKEEVFKLLDQYEGEAKLLAGGQSLIPMMNFRIARPGILVDINKILALDFIKEEGDFVHIGALTRERTIEKSPIIRSKIPLLAEATENIGHTAIRNRGTIGGSIAHGDPSAEYPMMAKTFSMELKLESSKGSRWVKADDFFTDYLTVDLQPNEMVTEIKVPVPPKGTTYAFEELARRKGDFAIVAVGVMLALNEKGICQWARIGLCGVDAIPVRANQAEALLIGETLTDGVIGKVSQEAAKNIQPTSDMHATEEYRRDMVRVFTQRCLKKAIQRRQEKV